MPKVKSAKTKFSDIREARKFFCERCDNKAVSEVMRGGVFEKMKACGFPITVKLATPSAFLETQFFFSCTGADSLCIYFSGPFASLEGKRKAVSHLITSTSDMANYLREEARECEFMQSLLDAAVLEVVNAYYEHYGDTLYKRVEDVPEECLDDCRKILAESRPFWFTSYPKAKLNWQKYMDLDAISEKFDVPKPDDYSEKQPAWISNLEDLKPHLHALVAGGIPDHLQSGVDAKVLPAPPDALEAVQADLVSIED